MIGDVLAVDVGATSIKFRRFGADGVPCGPRAKRATPQPCTPDRLVQIIAGRAKEEPVEFIGVGFPGEVRSGVIIDGANLMRTDGPTSPIDPGLEGKWRGFALRDALISATGVKVVVGNDAAMAARGCATGIGTELVITLGTGCGFALVRAGELVPVRDVGDERLVGSETYDQLIGERGRRHDEVAWLANLVTAVSSLATEFSATTIHLCGGNARRVSRHSFGAWSSQILIERDDPALFGCYRAVVG